MTNIDALIEEAEKMEAHHAVSLQRWQAKLRELKAYRDNLRKGKNDGKA